jgi:multidrug efflux pump subunit AcrA (membrane-fusion protein)
MNVQNVVTFEVRIEVTSDNKTLLKPEMTANVYIVVAEKEDTLTVPATSIMRKKRDTFVKLAKEDGSTEERPVQIGITDYVNTEVVDGLQEGDAVVVQKPEDESRWRNSPEAQRGMQNRMMMRTLGGGGGGGRH